MKSEIVHFAALLLPQETACIRSMHVPKIFGPIKRFGSDLLLKVRGIFVTFP